MIRVGSRLTFSAGKMLETGQSLVARFRHAQAGECRHRTAIERELFGDRYRLSSKNDDDLPVVRTR